ncbi:hypothetical protein Tco_0169228 [Tanacetum coccineum]
MVRKEAPIGFLSKDGKDLRPADLLLFNWIQGKDACLDVIGISPFAGMRVNSWAPGVALHNPVKKRRKYATKCADNGYKFIPFAFSTFGEFDKDALDIFSHIGSLSISHSNNPKSSLFIFHGDTRDVMQSLVKGCVSFRGFVKADCPPLWRGNLIKDNRDVMQSLLRGCDEFKWVRLKLRLSATWRGNLLGLQPCRMSMKMDGARVQDVHKEYNGPQYEIKTRTTELAMEAGYAQTTPFHVVTTLIFRLCSLN